MKGHVIMERRNVPKGKQFGNDYLPKPLMDVIDVLKNEDNAGDAIALYMFLLHTAQLQNTGQPFAANKFCMKGLHWGKPRLISAQETLEKLGLIKSIQKQDFNTGKWQNKYTKVNRYLSINGHVNREHHSNPTAEESPCSPGASKSASGFQEANANDRGIFAPVITSANAPFVKENNNRNTTNKSSIKELKALLQANKDTICPSWKKGYTFILSFNDFDKRSKCHSCPIKDICKKLNEGNITLDGHIYNRNKYIEDDGRGYNLCPDGNYRNKAGEIYIP